MAQVTVQATDIKGLTPAISAVNSSDTYALSGTNYVFDSQGPKTAFGSRIVNGNPFWAPLLRRGFQVIRASNKIVVCTNEALFELEIASGKLIPILAFEPFQLIARWTNGFLNGVEYFCHPGIGVLFWDQRNGTRGHHNVPGMPSSPIAIVVDNGRLVVLDNKTATWSAPSDGSNFIPSVAGAGVQVVSDRVSGDPIMVTSYSRGFLVWTNQGVMRSEFSGGVEVYRHRGINTEYRPINSFCVVKLDDETTVILDPRGLFSSRGEPPVPFTSVFNEFLIEELKNNDSLVGNNIRMEWDAFARRIYISRAFQLTGELYDQALVLYQPLEKWGSFDFPHYGIGRGYWLNQEGYLCQFAGLAHMQQPPVDTTSHRFDPLRQYPPIAQRQRQSQTLSSVIRLSALPESQSQTLLTPGLYTFNGAAELAKLKSGLDGRLTFGLFRLQSEEIADQLIEVNEILVGSVLSRELSTSDVDYNLIPPGVSDEDYNVAIGNEDFGLNPLSFINFQLRSLGTIDGHTVFTSKTPSLARFVAGLRVFSGGALGIWHSLELTAQTEGEYFHLRHVQLNGMPAGRLL